MNALSQAGAVLRDPALFAQSLLIKLKASEDSSYVAPLVYKPLQLRYLKERSRRDIILKSRQIGFSTLIQAEFLRYAFTRPVTTLTLMDTFDNTDVMREKVEIMYKNFPERIDVGDGLYLERPARSTDRKTAAKYSTGAVARLGTAGKVTVGRGDSYQCIHLSEIAFFKDAARTIAGAGEAGNPFWIVLESTANGARGHFYELVNRALDGDPSWKLHFYPWFMEQEYQLPLLPGEVLDYDAEELALIEKRKLRPEQIKWRRATKARLRGLFLQEYPEDPKTCFLRSGYGFFGDTSGYFTAPIFASIPDPSVRVVAGLDWGQANDFTVLSVVRADTGQQLAVLRWNKESYPDMRARVVKAVKKWNIRLIVAEKNSMGQTNIEQLRLELRAAGLDEVRVRPFVTDHNSKRELIIALSEALDRGHLKLIPDEIQMSEFSGFQAKQNALGSWSYGAPDGEHDDTVMSCGFAWKAVSLGAGVDVKRM